MTAYKHPSMLITCIDIQELSGKEGDGRRESAAVAIPDDVIVARYRKNAITRAICFTGHRPLESFESIFNLISSLRNEYHCDDTVVIYTNEHKTSISYYIDALKMHKNIIAVYGQSRWDTRPRAYCSREDIHFDPVLGIYLSGGSHYSEVIS